MRVKKYILALGLTAGLYALLVLSVYFLQEYVIFQPTRLSPNHSFSFDHPFEEHNLVSFDSTKINSIFFPTPKEKKGAVLYLHGNADDLSRWGKYTVDFTSRGYDVFIIDYRGYGKSGGEHDEQAMYKDASIAYNWLKQKHRADQIILYGRSLGSSIASELASKVSAKKLILETPFNSINELFKSRIAFIPLPFDLDYQFANDRNLRKINYPIHIIHGTKDEVVPLENALKLKPLLKEHDSFTIIEKGMHKNLRTYAEYQVWLDQVLD